ncbi:hypothetical protein BRAO375_3880026 [Bradyrhizobium sp. ORS 375]|nr:hypothetical protein BRAO375_3880026 [Bradyrhizobium sp. ORS 375]
MDVGGGRRPVQAVLASLTKIRTARSRLQLEASDNSTPEALLSQIELCNALLDEIQSISCSLDKRVEHSCAPNRRPVANRRHRGTAHLVAPRRVTPGRTKQQR